MHSITATFEGLNRSVDDANIEICLTYNGLSKENPASFPFSKLDSVKILPEFLAKFVNGKFPDNLVDIGIIKSAEWRVNSDLKRKDIRIQCTAVKVLDAVEVGGKVLLQKIFNRHEEVSSLADDFRKVDLRSETGQTKFQNESDDDDSNVTIDRYLEVCFNMDRNQDQENRYLNNAEQEQDNRYAHDDREADDEEDQFDDDEPIYHEHIHEHEHHHFHHHHDASEQDQEEEEEYHEGNENVGDENRYYSENDRRNEGQNYQDDEVNGAYETSDFDEYQQESGDENEDYHDYYNSSDFPNSSDEEEPDQDDW